VKPRNGEDDAPPDAITAAHGYASIGLRPFPLGPRSKKPWAGLTRWQVKASADPAAVGRLFDGKVDANVGLAMGRGVFAMDVDACAGGFESADRFAGGRELPLTATAHTGGGGRHQLYRVGDGERVRNRTGMLPGLDVRGDGGYIAVWPSVHPETGRLYTWNRHPCEGIADAPAWLVDALAERHAEPAGKARRGASEGAGTSGPGLVPTAKDAPPLDRDGDPDDLFAEAVVRFPVPGLHQRNGVMVRLIGSLLARRFKVGLIVHVVERWWLHFHGLKLIGTDPRSARSAIYLSLASMYCSPGFRWELTESGYLDRDSAVNLAERQAYPLRVPVKRLKPAEGSNAIVHTDELPGSGGAANAIVSNHPPAG